MCHLICKTDIMPAYSASYSTDTDIIVLLFLDELKWSIYEHVTAHEVVKNICSKIKLK